MRSDLFTQSSRYPATLIESPGCFVPIQSRFFIRTNAPGRSEMNRQRHYRVKRLTRAKREGPGGPPKRMMAVNRRGRPKGSKNKASLPDDIAQFRRRFPKSPS